MKHKYTSKNGYTGVMYGKSSFAIYDSLGHEIMHTGYRSFNTYRELVDRVENFPKIADIVKENT